MYVRRKKFVRRRLCERSSFSLEHSIIGTSSKAVSVLAVIIAVMVATGVAAVIVKPLALAAFKVDPEVQASLMQGVPVDVYVVVEGSSVQSNVPYSREWRFGDLRIVKIRLTSMEDLSRLLSIPGVKSVWACKRFHHGKLYWLDPNEYPFREYDADNKFHEADGFSWIGRNVTVAIIDTGIDYTHPDFFDENNRSIIKCLVSVFYRSPNGSMIMWIPGVNGTIQQCLDFDMSLWRQYGEPAFLDINGHGTHVAGIIAGRGWASNGTYKGIAPGVKLVIIKAFTHDGSASLENCLDALQWVYDHAEQFDIKILSLSWGAAFASDGSDPVSMACTKIAEDKHIFVFAAAGNEGNYPTTIVVPAVAKGVFAVGAWDPYYDKLAPFSSLGPTVDMRMKPDFVGAGVMIVSCASQYVSWPSAYMVGKYYVALSGTSMATPAVAAVCADFIEYYRYWHNGKDPTPQDFINWVLHNGRHINFYKDFVTGYGVPIAPHS